MHSDKYLLVPLLVGECDPTVQETRTKTGNIADLWACARQADEPFNTWEVELDGKPIFKKVGNDNINGQLKNEILVRNSSKFNIVIPKPNAYDVPPGTYPAVVDGYYLPIRPLQPGEHILEYKITYEEPSLGFLKKIHRGDVTYYLTVKP